MGHHPSIVMGQVLKHAVFQGRQADGLAMASNGAGVDLEPRRLIPVYTHGPLGRSDHLPE